MLDRNEIAALLGSLCERPFGRDQEEQRCAIEASRLVQTLPDAEAGRGPDQAQSGQATRPGEVTAALASILSATATSAQCHGFQETAAISGAARLEAQSALAFVESIEHAPLAAPADLVEEVLASVGDAPPRPRPGVWYRLWSRLLGSPLGRRRGQVAAACAILLAGGLSWSLRGPADLATDHAGVPAATAPNEQAPIGKSDLGFAPAPPSTPAAAPAPGPTGAPAAAPAPPVAQALADPCAPGSSATSRGGARSKFETNAAKPAPIPQSKTASVLGPDPDCAVSVGTSEGGRNPRADRGPVRAARPAAKIGTLDRDPAAAAAPAPYAGDARPASPAMHPSSVQPAR
jgi:hypothetical protein